LKYWRFVVAVLADDIPTKDDVDGGFISSAEFEKIVASPVVSTVQAVSRHFEDFNVQNTQYQHLGAIIEGIDEYKAICKSFFELTAADPAASMRLEEIRAEQRKTDLCIDRKAFHRIFREIAQDFSPEIAIHESASEALQEAAEAYMINLFEEANLIAVSGKRKYIIPNDLQLVRRIRGERE